MEIKKIFEILQNYIKKAGAYYTYIINEDGFILADMRHIDSPLNLNKKELIKLYSEIENVYNVDEELINFSKRTESIIIKYDYYGLIDGMTILLKSVSDNLTLIAFIPNLPTASILTEFNKTVEKIASVFYPRETTIPVLLN